jgi:hypothetical protein
MADTSLLTPEIASQLTAAGLFTLTGPTDADELSEPQVRAIARAWIQDGFSKLQPRLEAQRGSKIDGSRLRDCARVYYGESPYEPVQDTSDGGIARRTNGPWWLVPLCAGDEPQVLLGIAAFATDIRLENGGIRLPRFSGGEFVWRAIRAGTDLPVTPEFAANAAARATAAKVNSVPRLILPTFRDGSPAAARWSMSLSLPAAVSTAGGPAIGRTVTVFFGPPGPGAYDISALQRPSAEQPVELEVGIWSWVTRTVDHVIRVKRKPDIPVRFEPAEVSGYE